MCCPREVPTFKILYIQERKPQVEDEQKCSKKYQESQSSISKDKEEEISTRE